MLGIGLLIHEAQDVVGKVEISLLFAGKSYSIVSF